MVIMKMENLLRIVDTLSSSIFEGYNINKISKLSGVDIATTYRALKEMERKNEVLKSRKGNNVFYKLNFMNLSTVKYCELASIEKRKSFIAKHPETIEIKSKASKEVDVALLFGSFARDKTKPNDIDLLLIYRRRKKHGFSLFFHGGKVSPIYMSLREFTGKLKNRNPVVMEMVKDGIIAFGEELFWISVKGVVSNENRKDD